MTQSVTALVSIIIPCFRQGRYLREAIDSSLTQTHPGVEVVVVNDGSDDNTDEVARNYGDRITYVSQKNSGLPAARNAGIRAATGDYLLFLDSDDRLHTNGVAALLSVATPGRLVVGQFEYFTDDPAVVVLGRHDRPVEPLKHGLPDDAALLIGNIASPCAFLCPRRAANEIGLFDTRPQYYGCEDWDFWVRLVLHGLELCRIPDVVSSYRIHGSSMTRRSNGRMDAAEVAILRRNLAALTGAAGPIADRTVGRREMARRIRRRMNKGLLALSYTYRHTRQFRAACGALFGAVRWGGLSYRELVEAGKIAAAASGLQSRRLE